jgi:MFS family permease
VLVLSILGIIFSFGAGLFGATCAGFISSWSEATGNVKAAQEAINIGASLFWIGILGGISGLIGGIISYRNWQINNKKIILGVLLLVIGVVLSLFNTLQIPAGILFGVAVLLTLIGGRKPAQKETTA